MYVSVNIQTYTDITLQLCGACQTTKINYQSNSEILTKTKQSGMGFGLWHSHYLSLTFITLCANLKRLPPFLIFLWRQKFNLLSFIILFNY